MPLLRSKPLTTMVELRFLVPPAQVEAARKAIAPYMLASVLPDGGPRQPAANRESQRQLPPGTVYVGVTQKELELLLRG